LFVVPYYGGVPVTSASLDIRLGNWFRTARRPRATEIDLSNRDERERIRREAQQEEYVPFGRAFALHPGDFALGVSLEFRSSSGHDGFRSSCPRFQGRHCA
jgi:deoxycytidine triphosphate deaminase